MKHLSLVLAAATVLLSGCSAGLLGNGGAAAGAALTGKVRGGQQPVSGATIQLYGAGTSGYASAATPLLSSAVTTDSGGGFSITGQYSCSGVDQVYLLATGGNPGLAAGTNNQALVMMAALGSCSALQNAASATSINVSEVTTIAGAWSLARFMTAPTMAGTSAGNSTGLQNAFAAVNKVVNLASGTAPGPALPANATLPVAEINTLADILAPCVNSNGSLAAGTPCTALFSAATPPGGTAPADTLTAALDIARNPSNNVAALYALSNAAAPFQPTLTSAPGNWLIGIHYVDGGLNQPSGVAIDAAGNVWASNGGGNSVSEFSNSGAALSPAAGYTAGNLSAPSSVAIDPGGNAWVGNAGNGSVTKLTALGGSATNYTGGGLSLPSSIAIDGNGNVFVTNKGTSTVTELSSSGTVLSGQAGFGGGGISGPTGVAINAH